MTKIRLSQDFFSDKERTLAEHGPLSASLFRFDSGVCGLRLKNERGQLTLLPFQGQQIWSVEFDGRNLTMRSMFDQPNPTRDFLATFGGFLQHCGLSGVGGPSAQDTHPLHGELPNAPYQQAYVVASHDAGGDYIGLGGQYQHTITFNANYLAEPLVKLYAGSTLFHVSMSVANLRGAPMEMMYLAHVNFRPVDHGRLVYSAPYTPEHVRVRAGIPSHIQPGPGYQEFLDTLRARPDQHHVFQPGLALDPEVVFFIDYLADADGYAHSMQIHPQGYADYIRHRPAQLPKVTRWISRTPDQDAVAIIEPGTAEPEGYLAEKAKGNAKVLPPQGKFTCEMVAGSLTADEAKQMEAKINQMARR
jgi:hypothetical protein